MRFLIVVVAAVSACLWFITAVTGGPAELINQHNAELIRASEQ